MFSCICDDLLTEVDKVSTHLIKPQGLCIRLESLFIVPIRFLYETEDMPADV